MREVATIAAYRDRWSIHDRTILGPNSSSIEHTEQRRIAQQAVTRAVALHQGDTDSAPAPARSLDPQLQRSVEL
jgi:hypothetical protein